MREQHVRRKEYKLKLEPKGHKSYNKREDNKREKKRECYNSKQEHRNLSLRM
jgi:hypothetical protein